MYVLLVWLFTVIIKDNKAVKESMSYDVSCGGLWISTVYLTRLCSHKTSRRASVCKGQVL